MMEGMAFPIAIHDMTLAERRDDDAALSVMGEDEFRALYERTARPLWAYLSRITGDSQKADDYLQETYYRFVRSPRRYESEAHRRNTLFQIATNLVRDEARRRRKFAEVPLLEDQSLVKSDVPSPEHQTAMRTDVARAMEQLDPLQRELLWLAYAQGESHEEIAKIVGLRAVSIRTVLLRARRKLAKILRGER
jgi:RNA polymerase sigma-70 factor, ECF subfamily